MRYVYFPLFIVLIALFAVSCGTDSMSDEVQIQALLENSSYVGEGALQTSDDGTNDPNGQSPNLTHPYLPMDVDTIPFTKWVRWIERPVTWSYEIFVTGDSADATITAFFHGSPPGYGIYVINDLSGPIWQRAITDSVVRKIKLYNDATGWHILSLTAADIYTIGATNPVSITEVKARVESRDYEWVINSADTYFEKDELPTFLPNDTIDVTVTVGVVDDSSWAFLHHNAHPQAQVGLKPHYRDPFYRENTTIFTRTWYIADDSIATPGVRHAAIDVLTWQTLFGDSTATYSAHAWSVPYIVKLPGQDIPDDE
jgi:hypothetical protein